MNQLACAETEEIRWVPVRRFGREPAWQFSRELAERGIDTRIVMRHEQLFLEIRRDDIAILHEVARAAVARRRAERGSQSFLGITVGAVLGAALGIEITLLIASEFSVISWPAIGAVVGGIFGSAIDSRLRHALQTGGNLSPRR